MHIDLRVISACIGQLRTQYVLYRYVALPVSAWVKNQGLCIWLFLVLIVVSLTLSLGSTR